MSALRPLHAILLLIAATAIAGLVWAVFVYTPRPDLQALAEASCKCARLKTAKADKEACWREFDIETANARANPGGSACLPLSERSIGEPGEDYITTEWGIVGGSEGAFCTREEAIAAEALDLTLYPPDIASLPPQDQSKIILRATEALENLSRAYARGDRAQPAQAQGCTQ